MFLKDLTVGIYQVNLAPSNNQKSYQKSKTKEFHSKVMNQQHREITPVSGMIRVRVYSRFTNVAKHQLWIAYIPTDKNESDCNDDPIQKYYCTCKIRFTNSWLMSQVSSVPWFMRYPRYEIIFGIPLLISFTLHKTLVLKHLTVKHLAAHIRSTENQSPFHDTPVWWQRVPQFLCWFS